MKRGEIAISVVIVIALGLIVLITLAIALNQGFTDLEETTGSCDTLEGTCMTASACQGAGGKVVSSNACTAEFTRNYENTWRVESYPVGGGVCCVT